MKESDARKILQVFLSGDKNACRKMIEQKMQGHLYVYKYCPPTLQNILNFQNGNIWLSNAIGFNDPFDSSFYINMLKKMGVENMSNDPEIMADVFIKQGKANKQATGLQKTMYVSCFSESINLPMMWGNYAANHYGFCLKYNLLELFDKYNILPVIYSSNYPILGDELSEKEIYEACLTKSVDWDCELEWRIIQKGIPGDKGSIISDIKPVGIYIGIKKYYEEYFGYHEGNILMSSYYREKNEEKQKELLGREVTFDDLLRTAEQMKLEIGFMKIKEGSYEVFPQKFIYWK